MLAANPRLARHLAWRHHRDRARTREAAWSAPRIIDISRWLEDCWEHSLLRGGAAGARQLLNRAQFLRAIDVVAAQVESADVPIPGARARRLLAHTWSLARDWGIGRGDLDAAAASADTRYFADFARRFGALCRERDWIDPPGLPAQLLQDLADGTVPLADQLVLAGFEQPTWQQSRLFAVLTDRGCIAGQLSIGADEQSATAQRCSFADERSERRHVAAWARQHLERRPDASIGIVVPDLTQHAADYRRRFLDAFDPRWRERDGCEFPIAIDDGATLADSGYVNAALLLLRVPSGRMDFRDVGQLLRSPYVAGFDAEASARARLDLRLRDGPMQTVDLRALSLRDDDDAPRTFLQALRRMLDLAEPGHARREPAAWTPLIETMLKEGGLGKGRDLQRDELRARDLWRGTIEQFATLGDVVGEVRFDAARRLLADAARERPLRMTPRGGGIQIMTPWEADGHQFDAVWLCAMTSESWPPVARPSPLIPIHLQRDRGVPDADPDANRADALACVVRLLRCAPDATASWARMAGEQEQVGSPIVLALPERAEAAQADVASADQRLSMLAGTDISGGPDVAPPLATDERARGGARLIDLQSACPARAFFELRLGAREMRSPPYALNAASRGTLLHDAAEFLYTALRAAGGPAGIGDDELEATIDAAIGRALDKNIPRGHPLEDTLRANERRRQQHILAGLVDLDRGREGLEIVDLEGQHEIEVGGLTLNVRFDRVDRVDGERLVVDYKTGAHFSISRCRGERPLQLQLPLYAAYSSAAGIGLCWLHAERVRIDAIAMRDFGLRFTGHARKRLLSEADWAALIADWRGVIETLAAEFSAGDARIDLEQERYATGQFAMLTRRWDIGHVLRPEELE